MLKIYEQLGHYSALEIALHDVRNGRPAPAWFTAYDDRRRDEKTKPTFLAESTALVIKFGQSISRLSREQLPYWSPADERVVNLIQGKLSVHPNCQTWERFPLKFEP